MTETTRLSERRLRTAVLGLFRPADPQRNAVGIEVEVIPVDLATGGRVPPVDPEGLALDPVLRSLAVSEGWTPAEPQGGGLPTWQLPGGGRLSWEPGGQLEYSSPALDRPFHAAELAASTMQTIAAAARPSGIGLLARGMDPVTQVQETRLLLDTPRYRRMTAHYARGGPAGERMMRLTAGIHVNLDLGAEPGLRWRAANRMVPALSAAFANSPARHGATEPWRSHRAEQWRQLDPSRTGVLPGVDSIGEYLQFATGAEAFLMGAEDARARPFDGWLDRASDQEIATHLTTLFPEVRPRRYLELRFFDALPAEGYDLVVAAAIGLLFDDEHLRWAAELPVPGTDRLLRAGRDGVRDSELRAEACEALERAAAGVEASDAPRDVAQVARRLRRFLDAFTRQARDPGDGAATHVDDGLLPEPQRGSRAG